MIFRDNDYFICNQNSLCLGKVFLNGVKTNVTVLIIPSMFNYEAKTVCGWQVESISDFGVAEYSLSDNLLLLHSLIDIHTLILDKKSFNSDVDFFSRRFNNVNIIPDHVAMFLVHWRDKSISECNL